MKNLAILLFFGYIAMAYAAGLLQNEDFSTQAELEARGGSKANLLNDTKVYVTADGLNKRLDEAITDGDLSGGGGDAGINFVTDASFEKETLSLDSSTGATETYETHTTDDKLYSEFNTKYFKSAYTGLTASDLYVRDTFSRTGLDDKQGLLSIWIKTDASDLDLCLRTDDATFTNACDSAYLLNVIGDNTWRKYEIPFVFGAASVQFEIFNESFTGNANIEVDKIYIGTIPDGYVSKIDTTITDWENFTPTGAWSGFYNGRYRRVGDMAEIRVFFQSNGAQSGILTINIPSGLSIDPNKINVGSDDSRVGYGSILDAGINRWFTFVNINDLNSVKFIISPDGSSGFVANNSVVNSTDPFVWGAGDVLEVKFSVPIVGWSTDYSTVVTQNTELTAQTANEFSFVIDGNGNVLSENYDVINGNCTENASSPFEITCNFNSGIFSQAPSCTTGSFTASSNEVDIMITSQSSNQLIFERKVNGVANDTARNNSFHCSKQGADVNKSATIIGKFENINSSELVLESSSYSATGTFVDMTSGYDIPSTLTVPRTGNYLVTGGFYFRSSDDNRVNIRLKNNGSPFFSEQPIYEVNAGNQVGNVSFGITTFNEGDILSVTSTSVTDATVDVVKSDLKIQELPDTQSIVKNLLAESSQTKCQTKYLSANVNSDGTSDNTDPSYNATLDSIEFNNLTVGKRYSVNSFAALGVDTDTGIGLDIIHDGEIITRNVCGNNAGISNCVGSSIVTFVATDSSLKASTASFSNTNQILYGDGTRFRTNLTLCQLSDTVVETNEW